MQFMRSSITLIIVFFSLILASAEVFGFAEEPITFRNPLDLKSYAEEESTIHTELTYLLALAAGFSEQDASTIVLWNQLVDSETLSGNSPAYSNCLGSYAAAPNGSDVCPGWPVLGWDQIWPMTFDSTCATSRFGPYSPFFHFPHNTDAELGALREWGWGRSQDLRGYAAYAWGSGLQHNTVFTADCRYMRPEKINTGLTPGSIEAFATYLHSLADFHSHSECMTALAAVPDKPNLWGTHTVIETTVPACYYKPDSPSNSDAHGQEFGTGTGTGRTQAAASAVFQELLWRSTQWWGEYTQLTMDTQLGGTFGTTTLQEAVNHFILDNEFQKECPVCNKGDFALNRRTYSDQVAGAILAHGQRVPLSPVLDCSSGPVWLGGSLYAAGVQEAYQAYVSQSGTIKIADQLPSGDLNFTDPGKNHTITLLGGYGCSFASQAGLTTIPGNVTISSGTFVVDRLIIAGNVTM